MITELCGGRGRRRQDGKGEANDGRTSASGRRRTMANKKSSATANESKSRSEGDDRHLMKADLLISLRMSLTVSLLVLIFISDLQVEVPERVIEGDKVTLTCKTTCRLTVRPTFTWYRNGHRLSSSTDQLHLQPVSRKDAGRYHCAVLGQNLRSPETTLNVRYGPKNISVSISPSGETAEGSSVNLTCSSDANPPVQNYTWFKEGGSSPVGSGHSYRALQSGFYYCVAQNEHGSQKSAAVTVTVKADQAMTLYVLVGVGLCGAAVFITIILLIWRKKKKRRMEEDDHQNVDPNAEDDTYTALDPVSRSSDDVYSTLATVHSSPSDDLYSALNPQSRSPEYDTLAVSESTCTDECFVAAGTDGL
ncbi:hypothetical protein MHYP_G00100210 [Metynnis hypsauchen]